MKKLHKCHACGKAVETFIRVKRKVRHVKIYQCAPPCHWAKDIERQIKNILNKISEPSPFPSPWVGMLVDFDGTHKKMVRIVEDNTGFPK